VRAQAVVTLAKLERFAEARQQLIALFCQPFLPGQDLYGPLHYCQHHLQLLQRGDDFSQALREALERPDVRQESVRLRIQGLCEKRAWDDARALTLRLAERPTLGPKVLSFYAVALADHRKPGALSFIKTHQDALRNDDLAWGNISHAYFVLKEYNKVLSWTADWESRAGLESWMLLNRVEALREKRQDTAAAQVSRAALALPPDYTQGWHALWLAFDAACEGKETSAFLADYDLSEKAGFFSYLHALVQVLEKNQQGAGVSTLRRLMLAGIGQPSTRPLSDFERRLTRRTGMVLLRSSKSWLVKLWCLWLLLGGTP
jgi:hypothetical protein